MEVVCTSSGVCRVVELASVGEAPAFSVSVLSVGVGRKVGTGGEVAIWQPISSAGPKSVMNGGICP